MDAIPHQDAHRNEHHNMPNVDPTRFLPVHGTTRTPQVDATSWCNTTRFLMIRHINFWKKAPPPSLLWSIKTERFKLCLVPTRGDIISYGYCLNRLASANVWSWIIIMSISPGKHQPQKHYLILKKTTIHWYIGNYIMTQKSELPFLSFLIFGKRFWWNQNRNWAPKPVWREMQSACGC